jgi:hypothetical protein
MTVDFEIRKSPGWKAFSVRWKGPWNERKIRAQFEKVAAWAKAHRLRTGRWVFVEPSDRTWEVAIEVKGSAKPSGGIRRRTFRPASVATVEFDPDAVSPRVIYHGISDWLRWQRKDKTIRGVGQYREVYSDNPWTNKAAWAHTKVQVVVRK